jgi:hypothetical protein
MPATEPLGSQRLVDRSAPRVPLARLVWRAWVVDPLIFGLVALPLTLTGQVRRVARLRHQRLDTTRTPASSPPKGQHRVGLATVATLLPTLVSFLAALLIVYLVYFGELYPLRPDAIAYLEDMFGPFPGGADSWGGPTLIGAWFVHAMVAVALQAVGLALIRGLGALCGRITRPLLGQ